MRLRDMPKASPRQGQILKARLDEIGMSPMELSRQLDVTPSFVTHVIKGRKRITTPERIDQVAQITGISSDELYLAIDVLPPDVERAIQRHPQMLTIIRQAAKQLDERRRPATAQTDTSTPKGSEREAFGERTAAAHRNTPE